MQDPKIVGIVLKGLQGGQGFDVKVIANNKKFKTQTYKAGKEYDFGSLQRSPYCGSRYHPMRTEGAFVAPQFDRIESRVATVYFGKKNFTLSYSNSILSA